MAVILGTLVAVTYGVGDFLGGLASKRNTPAVVVALSQACGLALMVLLGVALALVGVALIAAG